MFVEWVILKYIGSLEEFHSIAKHAIFVFMHISVIVLNHAFSNKTYTTMFCSVAQFYIIFELRHEISNNVVCATSKASD